MSETSVDFHSKYTGEQLEARLDRCNLMPTVTSVPGEDYLAFVDDEGTHAFRIGDECRYRDADSGECTFYKLRDITAEGKAVWGIVGEGAGGGDRETVTLAITSNQGSFDEAFTQLWIQVWYDGVKVDVPYDGLPVEVSLPAGKTCRIVAPEVRGYRRPEDQTIETVSGADRAIFLNYSAELVTVTASATDGTDCYGQVVTVRVGDDTLLEEEVRHGVSVLVPTGSEYVVTGSVLNGHKTPSLTYTASQKARSVALSYEPVTQTLVIFDRSVYVPGNITVESEGDLAAILGKVRRCLAKGTDDGVAICYLNDSSSTMYGGGSGASLDGTEGDVMTYLPDTYYRHETLDGERFRYAVNAERVDHTYRHFPASLVGTYKGHVADGKLYSRSGVIPTSNMTFDELKMAAKARGDGFGLIDYAQHCQLAMLLYAKYGTRDLQSVLGSGKAFFDTDNVTGTSDATGIADTTPASSGYVCGLGVEGIFGCLSEYMDGIYLLDGRWHVTDPDGTAREVEAAMSPTGWIAGMALEDGPAFDMIPTRTGGSGTMMYADFTRTVDNMLPLVASRGCFTTSGEAYQDDGIGYIDALDTSYIPSPYRGSRLSYRGKITVIDDVEEFKALPIIG